jgi:unsaturated pyranuronate lyase
MKGTIKMIVNHDSAKSLDSGTGVTRKNLSRGGILMAVEFTFEKGSVGAVHSHPHEQIGYIVKGQFELEMDGKKQTVAAGDTYYVPSDTPHGVVALEAGVIFDVFTPHRDDFIAQENE